MDWVYIAVGIALYVAAVLIGGHFGFKHGREHERKLWRVASRRQPWDKWKDEHGQ